MFIIEVVFLLLVIGAAILLVQGTRKIPVQYAKRIVGNKQYGGARQYIPLKVNAAGVMPIIFAQAIMFIPITFIGFSNNVNNAGGFLHAFTDHTSFWYNFVFAVMIILFTYFYTAITCLPSFWVVLLRCSSMARIMPTGSGSSFQICLSSHRS